MSFEQNATTRLQDQGVKSGIERNKAGGGGGVVSTILTN